MKPKELHQEIDTMSDNTGQQKEKRLPTVNERKMERERGRTRVKRTHYPSQPIEALPTSKFLPIMCMRIATFWNRT